MTRHRLSARVAWGAMVLVVAASGFPGACNRPGGRTGMKRAPIRDQSLKNEQYVALGVSAADHNWTGEELGLAASTLQTLAAAHPEQLPHAGSPNSGATFAHMVAPENLATFRSKTVPLQVRMGGAV